MNKHILIFYIFLANLSFIGGIKANHSYTPPYSVANIVSEKARLSIKNNQPVDYMLAKNDASGTLQDDSIRNSSAGLLFSNNKISISSVYPNPASAYASIDYSLAANANSAKIILCNVLGNVVGEYTLSKEARRLNISTVELTSGVYFYALYVDGKNVVTRKLIIKHNS